MSSNKEQIHVKSTNVQAFNKIRGGRDRSGKPNALRGNDKDICIKECNLCAILESPRRGEFFKSQIWVIGEFPGNYLVIPRYFDFREFFHPILNRVIEAHYPPRISDMG